MSHGVSATTTIAGVIGDPISQSLSPTIWNAGFRAIDLDWEFVAFPVKAGEVAIALDGIRALGVAGVSVTMPHKTDAATACDELDATASVLMSANLVRVKGGKLLGSSTDGAGFMGSLREHGIDPAGSQVVVMGSGAAARAIIHSLGEAGATVTVIARREEAARAAAKLAPGCATETFENLDAAVAKADLLVNATSLGMGSGSDEVVVSDLALAQLRMVLDIVYYPAETSLLRQARGLGVVGVNGLGMLIHQAAAAFVSLTGVPAPLKEMRIAVGG